MSKVRLIDICQPKQWKTIPTSQLTKEGYPVYGANGKIGFYSEYNHEKETILITCRGATCGSLNISEPFSYVNGNAMCLDNLDDSVLLKYLYYNLCGYNFSKIISGTAQPQITGEGLSKVVLNIHSANEQKIIVDLFEKLEKILISQDLYYQKLDELIKSRFVEMFGDPVSNPMKWHRQQLNELTNKIGSGATPRGGRDSYCTNGISLIRSMNVHNGFFGYKDLAHISDEQATKLSNVTIQKKDVLLNITGASVARCCVVPDDILPARVNQHVCIIRCNDYVIPVFVCKALTSDGFQKYLLEIAGSGATREAITKQQIESIPMIVPPLSLQKQFADFVTQVEKQKSTVQKSIDKLETLKKSLMQEYFG